MEQIVQQPSGPGKGKKIILISFGVLGLGVAGYFGYMYWQKRKAKKEDTSFSDTNIPEPSYVPPSKTDFKLPPTPPPAPVVVPNDEFPLKKGSKGAKVKQLQEALIQKNGKQILPRYGADSDFGNEVLAALTKLGYPSSIDESMFNVIVQDTGLDASETASALYNAATAGDFPSVIKALQMLKTKTDYTSVSDIFKNNYTIEGVRQTLVNGLLSSFSDVKQKQAIRLQFTRMGLNYNGKTWSLSGWEKSSLITVCVAIVWPNPNTAIKVPANMVLGKEVTTRGEHTLFENNGQHFLVKTNSIKTL